MRSIGAGYHLVLTMAACLSSGWLYAESSHAALAELPRSIVDTTYSQPRGKEYRVRQGGDLQRALDTARAGDVILLEAGASFTGPFRLPAKSGSGWIIVRTSAPDGILPSPGQRVSPAYAAHMPKLEAASEPVIVTVPGAHHYRFVGIEIRPSTDLGRSTLRSVWRRIAGTGAVAFASGPSGQTLVLLGTNETSIDRLPHHIIFDRCYIHGDPKAGARRGIAMNSRHTAVIDSYFSEFKTVGDEAQAIAGWKGPGPYKLENNYLEAAGEGVLFGGGVPSIRDLVPSDIEVRRNHFHKPLSWKIGDPAYEGKPWSVKNHFELKNARRVLIEGNLFEHSWVHAQDGFSILFTVRTEDDAVPWAVIEDVWFKNNVIRKSGSGINIMGIDDGSAHGNGRTRRITIRNNLFDEIGGEQWGGGRLFQLQNGTQDIVIENNTARQTGQIVWAGDARAHSGFVFSGNVVPHNEYGIIGSGTGTGHATLKRYFPGAVIRHNAMVGGLAEAYPPGNIFPASFQGLEPVDRHRAGVAGKSRAARAGVGAIGVDLAALHAALGPTLVGRALDAGRIPLR